MSDADLTTLSTELEALEYYGAGGWQPYVRCDWSANLFARDDLAFEHPLTLDKATLNRYGKMRLEYVRAEARLEKLKEVIRELIDPAYITDFDDHYDATMCVYCGSIRHITGYERPDPYKGGLSQPIWQETGHREDCPVTKAQKLLDSE